MVKKALKLAGMFALFFVVATTLHVLSVGYFHHTWSPLIVIRNQQALDVNPEFSSQQQYVPLDSISPNLILAVMCAEDQKFTTHNGFDFDAIDKAMKQNEAKGTTVGASTISQQTAKNVFMWPGRNWVRKGFEAYYTFLIETLWSKRRIMEAYLNIIEMGDGIYGAEAAANFYFDKEAKNLTIDESAALAAILPNPRKFSPTRPDGKMRNKIRNIKWFMKKYRHLLKDLDIKTN